MKLRYTYLSDGTKVSALDAAGDGLLYRGNFVYEKNGQDVILEQNDYLPYGTKSSTSSLSTDSAFRYRYAGKEEQRFGAFDSQLLDFGARYYDPWSCQWTAVDPFAEHYINLSPYVYCECEPQILFDPDGENPLAGAILGAAASYVGQVAGNIAHDLVTEGKVNLVDALTNIDIIDIGASALEGAITCGMSAVKKLGVSVLSNATQAAVDYQIGGAVETKSADMIIMETAVGVVGGAIEVGSGNAKIFGDVKSNNKAISEARNAAKKNGEHMSTEEIKKVVQKNDSRNKLVRDVNKTFGEFSKNAPSSISASAHNSFFDRLYDDEY